MWNPKRRKTYEPARDNYGKSTRGRLYGGRRRDGEHPVEQFHDLARYLHDDPALRFDFLRSLTGMDWGEEGLGAVYHLESTATGENVVLKVLTPSREQCGLPTVSDIWKGAELNEREVFDFFLPHKPWISSLRKS